MARLFFLVATVGVVTLNCTTTTSTQERQTTPPVRAEAAPPAAPVALPESPADVAIRHDLTIALARDAALHTREISFKVSNGDISLKGIVRTEDERRRINDLAMNINGVKSVANAMRVAE